MALFKNDFVKGSIVGGALMTLYFTSGLGTSNDEQLISDVFNLMSSEHVSQPSAEELARAMARSQDPHSDYFTQEELEDFMSNTMSQYAGIGAEVTSDPESGYIKIVTPIDDSPAFSSGLKAGDLITHIDNEEVNTENLGLAVEKLRGDAGTKVTLTIERSSYHKAMNTNVSQSLNITITRDYIDVPSVKGALIDGDIGYIRIAVFGANTASGIDDAVDKIKQSAKTEPSGYIIDVRNNPGGLLDQAYFASNSFLNEGTIVSIGKGTEGDIKYTASEGDLTDGKPIIVLTNAGSASASEILAGALQDNERATILGSQSFGKGSVQATIPLDSGGALKLTVQHYFTPSGVSIQGKGITPDIAYIGEEADTQRVKESELSGTLANPGQEQSSHRTEETCKAGDGINSESIPSDTLLRNGEADYQLLCAIDNIRGSNDYTLTKPILVPAPKS